MKNKLYLIVIPLITIAIASLGSLITAGGMAWYGTLKFLSIAPPGGFIGAVWTVIFILATISAILFWRKRSDNPADNAVVVLFLLNAILNILWSVIFFGLYLIGFSIIEMILLNATTMALVILLWRRHLASAILLLPYVLWVSFATYLAMSIWKLN